MCEVHHGDIVALHRAITDNGHPVLANRVIACASKMFSLALKPMQGEAKAWRDRALGNPCWGVEFNQEDGRERFLSTVVRRSATRLRPAEQRQRPIASASSC